MLVTIPIEVQEGDTLNRIALRIRHELRRHGIRAGMGRCLTLAADVLSSEQPAGSGLLAVELPPKLAQRFIQRRVKRALARWAMAGLVKQAAKLDATLSKVAAMDDRHGADRAWRILLRMGAKALKHLPGFAKKAQRAGGWPAYLTTWERGDGIGVAEPRSPSALAEEIDHIAAIVEKKLRDLVIPGTEAVVEWYPGPMIRADDPIEFLAHEFARRYVLRWVPSAHFGPEDSILDDPLAFRVALAYLLRGFPQLQALFSTTWMPIQRYTIEERNVREGVREELDTERVAPEVERRIPENPNLEARLEAARQEKAAGQTVVLSKRAQLLSDNDFFMLHKGNTVVVHEPIAAKREAAAPGEPDDTWLEPGRVYVVIQGNADVERPGDTLVVDVVDESGQVRQEAGVAVVPSEKENQYSPEDVLLVPARSLRPPAVEIYDNSDEPDHPTFFLPSDEGI